jgi:uncharacterized membrane protein YbaN (DUF454 family)
VSALTGGPTSQRDGEGKGIPVRGSFLGRGLVSALGRIGALWPFFLFSIFFLLFFFCFSYFFHNFCKDTSIQTKLLPEIFKRDAQYSKSVIKQVFK